MRWITKIISAIASGLLGKVMQRRDQQRAIEAEQKAEAQRKKLESASRSRAQERKIGEAGDGITISQSPAHRNKRTVDARRKQANPSSKSNRKRGGGNSRSGAILLLLTSMMLLGCETRHVYYEPRMPVIDKPHWPMLPEQPPDWTARELLIVEHAERLEALIDEYNRQARKHNREHGYNNE